MASIDDLAAAAIATSSVSVPVLANTTTTVTPIAESPRASPIPPPLPAKPSTIIALTAGEVTSSTTTQTFNISQMTPDDTPDVSIATAVTMPEAEVESFPSIANPSTDALAVDSTSISPAGETALSEAAGIEPTAGTSIVTEGSSLDAVNFTADTSTANTAVRARGSLVVLEGLDRSGKSTQVKLLAQRFLEAGRKATVMRFPDRSTPIGKMIDAYLKNTADMDDHVIHLLFSANRWEAARTITSLLESGTSVLCDRYYYSGVVYSAAKKNPTLSLQWARQPELGLPRPDIVLFLDLDENKARERGGWGDEVYEKADMQKRVRELFHVLSKGGEDIKDEDVEMEGNDSVKHRPFQQEQEDLEIIDAGAGIEEVSEEIWAKVLARLEAREKISGDNKVRVVS
ncbi:Thymidylate kinase [Ceratocystis fimbriata CBS 114723]|uniref:Thymidylate kinase n=1 Tax=Ceratocystis fimbriata CBS 114723 TaxID=1035309 RepID=A0A2C5WWA1_9PEZI|nr:Thymidylate kinase [Ceratocystis fimbriata CBS 114723]